MYALHLWLWLHNDEFHHLESINRDKSIWRDGEAMDDAFENWFPVSTHPINQTGCTFVATDCYVVHDHTTRGQVTYVITLDGRQPVW